MTDVPAELTKAITAVRDELARQTDDEAYYLAAIKLVDLLLQRDQLTGAEPEEAIGIAYRLTAAIAEDSPARIAPLYDLCLAHLLRATNRGEDDLRAAMGYWRQLRPLVTADHPARAEIFARVGMLVADAVVRLADAAGVEEAIADLGIAIDGLAEGDLRRAAMLTRAQLQAARFRALGGDDGDRQHAVETFTEALSWPDAGTEIRDVCHHELVFLVLLKDLPAAHRRELDDELVRQLILDLPKHELRVFRRHLDALSDEAAATPEIASLRSGAVIAQGAETSPHDWEVLASDLGVLIEHSPHDSPDRARMVVVRAAMSADPQPAAPPAGLAELDESLGKFRKKLISDLTADSIDADVLTISALLMERAGLTGADPAKTIEIATGMAALYENEPPSQVFPLYQLALAHSMREGSDEYLRRAVGFLRQLRPLLRADTPGRAEILARGGMIIAKLVAETDELDHVDDAIADLDAALPGLEDGKLRRNASITLASMHLARFSMLGGDEDDRRKAIAAFTEALQRTDASPANRDTCHIGIAYLLLLKNVPADQRQERLGTDRLDEILDYVDEAELPAARQHLAAVSAKAVDPEVAALRLLVWTAQADKGHVPNLAAVLDDLATATGQSPDTALSGAELDAIRTIKSALANHEGDADSLINAAAVDLLPESPVRLLLTLHRLSVDGVQGLSPEELADLISWQEQQIDDMPEGAPERAEGLTALAGALLTQSRRDNAGSAEAHARIREVAEQVVREYPSDNIAAGFGHTLLAFGSRPDMELESVDAVLAHIQRADVLLPAEHEMRIDFGPALGAMLLSRFVLAGNREDIEAAGYYAPDGSPLANLISDLLDRIAGSSIGEPDVVLRDLRPVLEGIMPEDRIRWIARMAASTRLLSMLPLRHDDMPSAEQLDALAASLSEAPEALDPELRARLTDGIGSIRKLSRQAGPRYTGRVDLDGARRALDEARQIPQDRADYVTENVGAAFLCMSFGLVADDLQLADYGLAVLGELSGRSLSHDEHLVARMLAFGRQARYGRDASPAALDMAIDEMERMVRDSRSGPGEFLAVNLELLATNYRRRDDPALGDRQRANEANLEALRARARSVLLQSSPRRAMHAASDAAGKAVRTARRCLDAQQAESAVHALELGRGMVLHAATTAASIPELLRENGKSDLALRWEAEVDQQQPWDTGARWTSGAASPLPSDLRQKVLRALEGTTAEEKLLSPTAISDIGAELRARNTRALVYLISGQAVLVTDDGTIHQLPCPKLSERHSAAKHFDLLQQELSRAGAVAQDPWQAAMDAVCDWAWEAALGPILDWLGAPDPPRIVLVPTGKFTVVPWHAARYRTPGGEHRYACQDAVIAYAASARQFVEAVHRHPRPWQQKPVLVRTPELYWTRHEVGHIHDAHYPNGSYLGRPGPRRRSVPTPDDVLAALPGASLLHLSCHADQAEIPVESALRLGGGRSLPVRDVLRQHHENGPHAALIVLAACASDLTVREHDEVLTLATAFLAAGASGVIGTKWEIDDLATAMFMIAFHHHLNTGHPDPAAALRAAQLWMLDPDRRPIRGAPKELTQHFAATDPTAPMHWAAFTYHGR